MKFSVLVLLLNGVFALLFGIAMVLFPDSMFEMATGDSLGTASALIDVRAVYGGLSIGLGMWQLFCALGEVRLGLLSAVFAYFGIVMARIFGLLASHPANQTMYIFLAMEIAFLLLNLLAWQKAQN